MPNGQATVSLFSIVRKLSTLDRRDRLELLPAAWSLFAARLRLRFLPFPRALQWATAPAANPLKANSPLDRHTNRRIRAVERVGHRLFPHNPCLTEALVVQRFLRRRGYLSDLRFGVRKAQSRLEAHAWVEYRGTVIIGARGLSREHVPLPQFGVSSTGGKADKRADPNVTQPSRAR